MITWEQFLAWAEANNGADCRLQVGGGRWHVGALSVQVTTGGGKPPRVSVRVADARRAPRSRYATVFERHLEERFQLHVGVGYRPLLESDL